MTAARAVSDNGLLQLQLSARDCLRPTAPGPRKLHLARGHQPWCLAGALREHVLRKYVLTVVSVALALAPAPARADVVWPALILEGRIMTWWAIGAGLLVEWPVAKHITGRTWAASLWPNVAMNLVSSLLGIVLIPIVGFLWDLIPEFTVYRWFHIGTFNPFSWCVTVLLAALVNGALEAVVLRRLFKAQVTKRGLLLLVIANLVSVGIAMASILISPLRT